MALSIETQNGKRITVEADSALIGRDRTCQIVLPDETALRPIHAKIRKVADRWMVEAQGDWHVQVGEGLPGRMCWLKSGDVIRLTESGSSITFHETPHAPPGVPSPNGWPQKLSADAKPADAKVKTAVPIPGIVTVTPPAIPQTPEPGEDWFFARAGEKNGPFSATQIRQFVRSGIVQSDDLVWMNGMAQWVPTASIPALFPAARAIPPQPPVPSSNVLHPPATPSSPPPTSDSLAAPPAVGVVSLSDVPGAAPAQVNFRKFASIPFANLGGPLRSALWVKAVSGAGLFLVLIGLLSPWYVLESSSSVDFSAAYEISGNRTTKNNMRGNGFSFDDDGMGRASASARVTLGGVSTLPGILGALGLLGAAGLSFVPRRWAAVGAAGACLVVFLAIMVSWIYTPNMKEGVSGGNRGMSINSKTEASPSWGQFVTGFGNTAVIAGAGLALFAIGSSPGATRNDGHRPPTAA